METLLQDLRFTFRSLARSPGFTLVAVLTIALGIGAATAIYTAVQGILIQPLPYDEPDELVRLIGTRTDGGESRGTLSLPDIRDLREQSSTLTGISGYDEWTAVLGGEGEPERVPAASVESPFFSTLGVQPRVGRFFVAEEDRPGHEPAAVISHELWVRRYGSDPAIVGTTMDVGGIAYRIVGVAPADFEDPHLSGASFDKPELWRVTPDYFDPASSTRSGRAFTAIARLSPGASLEEAGAEITSIAASLAATYADDVGRGVALVPLKEEIVGPLRPALLLLLAATGLVVLISCANIANLLLTRGAGRQREFALRGALGASRARVIRQLVTESLALSALGGVVGVLFASWLISGLVALGGPELVRADQIRFSLPVFAFAAVISLLAGLVFGLAPALRSGRVDLQSSLRGRGRTAEPSERSLRSALVVAEVVISLMLLSGAGLLLRSLQALQQVDSGMRTEGVLTMELDPPAGRYETDESVRNLYQQIEDAVEAVPGVSAVGTSNILPLSGSFNGMTARIAGEPEPAEGEALSLETRVVSAGAMDALGIPLLRGRSLEAADREGSLPVALIDERLAEQLWPGGDAIGRRIIFGRNAWAEIEWEIVGIVGETRQFSLMRAPEPTLYIPAAQVTDWSANATLLVRADEIPAGLAASVQQAIRSVDPSIPISDLRWMDEVAASTIAAPRFRTVLLTLFAAMAFLLGAVGIYGVVSYSVSSRIPELGVRMALGGSTRRIRTLLLRQGMSPVLIGAAIGIPLSLLSSRLLTGMLYGVTPADPATFVAAVLALGVVAALACWVPTRRAVRVSPMTVLRDS